MKFVESVRDVLYSLKNRRKNDWAFADIVGYIEFRKCILFEMAFHARYIGIVECNSTFCPQKCSLVFVRI